MNKFDEVFQVVADFYKNAKSILEYDKIEITEKWEDYNDSEDMETEIHILLSFGDYKYDISLNRTEYDDIQIEPKYQLISGDKTRGYRTPITNLDKDEIEKIACENFLNSLTIISKNSPLFKILNIDRIKQ